MSRMMTLSLGQCRHFGYGVQGGVFALKVVQDFKDVGVEDSRQRGLAFVFTSAYLIR